MIAQWREVVKDKVFALYVHNGTHRVAIAQAMENQVWMVTMPDDPTAKHQAKTQDEAFTVGRKMALTWFEAALTQLNSDKAEPKKMTPAENTAEVRNRQRTGGRRVYST